MREVVYLIKAGSEELRAKFPTLLETTPDGRGIDVITFKEQGDFATDWLKNASEEELAIVDKAFYLHFNVPKHYAQNGQIIIMDFFFRDTPEELGKYYSNLPFVSGHVEHANVSLSAEEDDNWDIFGIPVLISYWTDQPLPPWHF